MYAHRTNPLIAMLLPVLLAACSSTPAEQQIRESLQAAAAAAQAADAGAFGDVLSDEFDGNRGELDRTRLLNMLRVQRLRGAKPCVLLGPISIEARGDRYVTSFTATLSGGGRILPDRIGIYSIETAWKRVNGDWLCYSASWKRKL